MDFLFVNCKSLFNELNHYYIIFYCYVICVFVGLWETSVSSWQFSLITIFAFFILNVRCFFYYQKINTTIDFGFWEIILKWNLQVMSVSSWQFSLNNFFAFFILNVRCLFYYQKINTTIDFGFERSFWIEIYKWCQFHRDNFH